MARDARVSLVDLGEIGVDGDGKQRVPVPAHEAQLDLVAHVDLEREVSRSIRNFPSSQQIKFISKTITVL